MSQYRITMENLRYDPIRDKPYGEGTVNSPYKISSAENLVYLAEHEELWDGYYFIQTNNIDMSNIPNWDYRIYLKNSNYNGNGFSIGSLTMIDGIENNKYRGLFANLANCIVVNITIKNSLINFTDIYSYANNQAIGFISASLNNSTLKNCIVENSEINMYQGLYIGGITGRIGSFSILEDLVSNVVINVSYYGSNSGCLVGNVVGRDILINRCIAKGSISAYSSIGGLIGRIQDVDNNSIKTISNCYSLASVTSTSSESGGFIGYEVEYKTGSITYYTNCFSYAIHNLTYGKGFIGYSQTTGGTHVISRCFYMDDAHLLTKSGSSPYGTLAEKTSAQFTEQSEFTDWDFTDIWEMGALYPILRFESLIIEKQDEIFEYTFPYPIIANTTRYDPFSYISYDYMISTSRRGQFEALVLDYFDEENYDFVNSLMRVGYSGYDNDISLYNHFYYDAEEDESVLIELDDVTIKYDVGEDITDKYGENRTVSSREIVTEGVSTVMCRIYERVQKDEEILVYSGLIDKRNTSFDGKKMKISLVDIMGLYVELSEKYNVVVSDTNNSQFGIIDLKTSIKSFINLLKKNINIDNKYLPDNNNINEYIDDDEKYISEYFNNYTFNGEVIFPKISFNVGFIFFIYLDTSYDDNNNLIFTVRNSDEITGDFYIQLRSLAAGSNSLFFLNNSNITTSRYILKVNTGSSSIESLNMDIEDYAISTDRNFNATIPNIMCVYNYETGFVDMYPNFAVIHDNSQIDASGVESQPRIALSIPKSNSTMSYNSKYKYSYDVSNIDMSGSETGLKYEYAKLILDEVYDDINSDIESFQNDFNAIYNSSYILLICANNNNEVFNDDTINQYVSIYEDVDDNNYSNLLKVESITRICQKDIIVDSFGNASSGGVITVFTDRYFNSIPLYSKEYSLYDITKLFSLTCYNRILTKNTGEMYFDAETYNASGYIEVNYKDIYDNYNQSSMIGDDEEFDILDNVYIGQKYIKEAYKRLESSTKENYKKLYENNNTKISMVIDNIDYYIYKDKDTLIGNRKLSVNDEVRIMKNSSVVLIRFFVTSIKYVSDGYFINIEGITMTDSNEGGGIVQQN